MLFLKGILIGIGRMLPGISGGMIAVMLGVYDKGLFSLLHWKKKESIQFLFVLGSGILVSMILSSYFLLKLLNQYYLPTMLFFLGLLIGTLPPFFKTVEKTKMSFVLIFLAFLFMTLISFCKFDYTVTINGLKGSICLLFVGFLEAGTIIIPGISGTALLMILGYYNLILTSFSHLTSIFSFFLELSILLPFGIGLFFGILFFLKLMDYSYYKYQKKFNSLILGFSLSSIFFLFQTTLKINYSIFEISIGVFVFFLGIFLSSFFKEETHKL